MLSDDLKRKAGKLGEQYVEILYGLIPVRQDLFREAVDNEIERKMAEARTAAREASRSFSRTKPRTQNGAEAAKFVTDWSAE